MYMMPAALDGSGNSRRRRVAAAAAGLTLLTLFAGVDAGAETAADVMKKMAKVYTGVKSLQCSIVTYQAGTTPEHKPFSVTQTEQIQYEAPNRFHKSVRLAGTGYAAQGPSGQQLAMRQGDIYSDGKTATMYVSSRKMYQKQPAPPTIGVVQLIDVLRLVPPVDRAGIALLPTTGTVNGHSVYMIEVTPIAPKNLPAADLKRFNDSIKSLKQRPRFKIDKQNYSLLEYSLITKDGVARVNINSQVFGKSVPAKSFVFNPPAGSKELKVPKPGQGPGMGPGTALPPGLRPGPTGGKPK